MDVSEVESLLAKVKYKDNVSWGVYPTNFGSYGMAVVKIMMVVPDSRTPDYSTIVELVRTVPDYIDEEYFYKLFGTWLREIEIHECQEWYQWKETGEPLDDPHKYD